MKACSFEGCTNQAEARFCGGHAKQKRLGQPLTPLRAQRRKGATPCCEYPGCGRPHNSRGLCTAHYEQLKAKKPLFPLYSTQRRAGTPPVIEYDESPCPNPNLKGPCHVFRGGKSKKGYGQVCIGNKPVMVHRYVWEKTNGPIPKGLVMDHQCRTRACCNVDHLRVVTMKVNLTENVVGSCWQLCAARTHCPKGHPYDKANTWISKKGSRNCRTCNRLKQAARQQKKGATP